MDNSKFEKLEHHSPIKFVVRIHGHEVERIMCTATLCYVACDVKVRQPTVVTYVIDFLFWNNNVSKTTVTGNLYANCTFEYFAACV